MNIRPTDLPLLVSLHTLLEVRNVTRAAKLLHISQPALSAQLARLRVIFKDQLLTPSGTGRGMVATPKGLKLAEPLRDAIDKLSQIRSEETDDIVVSDARIIRITGRAEAIDVLGPHLIRRAQRRTPEHPPVRLHFVEMTDDNLDAQFESGDVDLLLGISLRPPPRLRTRLLGEDRHVLMQRRRHPRGNRPLAAADYFSLQHVQVVDATQEQRLVDDYLRRNGQHRQISVSVPLWSMVRDILLNTDMVATVPVSLAATSVADKDLDWFELPFQLPGASLAMAWHRRSDDDPTHRWLRESDLDFNLTPLGPPGLHTVLRTGLSP